MSSTNSLARTAGVLYLIVGVGGGFAEYIRSSVTVAGNAQATAARIVEHAGLFRFGIATDLLDFASFLGVGLILYTLLRRVSPGVAMAMLAINAVSVAMQAMNMVNQVEALLVATNATWQSGTSALMFLELHRQGYLIAQVFFGGYLLPLGYLVYRSGMFPKALGIVLIIGGAGYLLGIVTTYLTASLDSSIAIYFGLAGGLAETAFLLWLLAMGARAPKIREQYA